MKVPHKKATVFHDMTHISHGFFGREGGVSKGKYAGLNTGQGSEDDPQHVAENRKRVAETIGTTNEYLLSAHQCHSTDVGIVDAPWPKGQRPKVDAIVTKTPGIACSALAADCVPVLFADSINGVVAAAHAGWRGALAGITDKTIEAMETIGANREFIDAAIGPCIGPDSFEVGPEFVDQFIEQNPASADLFTAGTEDRSYFDIKSYLIRRLQGQNIRHISALQDCTYTQNTAYFSYRYNTHNGIQDYGRNISVIMLK